MYFNYFYYLCHMEKPIRKKVLDNLAENGINLAKYMVIVDEMPDNYYRASFSHREDKRIYGAITIKINQNQ